MSIDIVPQCRYANRRRCAHDGKKNCKESFKCRLYGQFEEAVLIAPVPTTCVPQAPPELLLDSSTWYRETPGATVS